MFETSDYYVFSLRTMSDSIRIIRRRSSQTLSTGPPIVKTSKYQMLMSDLTLMTISLLLLLARLINRQDVVFDDYDDRQGEQDRA